MDLVKTQIPWWRKAWDENPLRFIMLIALIIRVLAGLFSKGYAFHDDHFDVIRVAQDWVDGIPHWIADTMPPNHSMFYAGINAIFIYLSELVGISDPQFKMVIIRLIHGIYSLLIVYYSYKITELLASDKEAKLVGLVLALLWFMPFLGVKNLAEMVCIPPVLAAFYLVLKHPAKMSSWLFAGMLFGLAFTVRFHVVLFSGGMGIVLLYKKQIKEALIYSVGFLLIATIIVGGIDYIFWDYPFQSLEGYFTHNANHAYQYSTGPWYRFLLTVFGFAVPPISVILFIGFAKARKVEPMMWMAALAFFVIHSVFPNKQERFIIPFFPFFIIFGVIGWNLIIANSKFWSKRIGLQKDLWGFFWTANVIACLALAFTYSKKDRIEPLYFLEDKGVTNSIIVETPSNNLKHLPEFYIGKPAVAYRDLFKVYSGIPYLLENGNTPSDYIVLFEKSATKTYEKLNKEIDFLGKKPEYVIFKRDDNIQERVSKMENLLSSRLTFEEKIIPSVFDRFLHILNPRVHKKEIALIYKVKY